MAKNRIVGRVRRAILESAIPLEQLKKNTYDLINPAQDRRSMTHRPLQSYLAKYQPKQNLDGAEIQHGFADAYHRHRLVVIPLDRLASVWETQIVDAIGERLYGRR